MSTNHYEHNDYLLSTEALANMLAGDTSKLRLFDVAVTLVPNPPGYKAVSGVDDYLKAHIPGAAFMDIAGDFSDTSSGLGFTLPSAAALQAAYQAAGIDDDSQVVFYSSGHMMWATRAWWMLYSCGHQHVSVLDGGFARWQAEGRDMTVEQPKYARGAMQVTLDAQRWTNKAQTLAAINDGDICTINALAPGVYDGSAEMHYGRKGHIANSKNVYYSDLLDNGCFRSASELKKIFTDKGVLNSPRVIAYCGGGISATIDALALSLIGHDNVAVYDGSMSEWVKDESLPLVTGSD
jgi:thiosulfate/3-mercaptopyruvate sulfurtransferase